MALEDHVNTCLECDYTWLESRAGGDEYCPECNGPTCCGECTDAHFIWSKAFEKNMCRFTPPEEGGLNVD